MKFTGTFRAPRFNLTGYRKAVDNHFREVMAGAIMEWLEATVMTKVPVWSGASRATFIALARNIGYNIPIFPVAPSRTSRGEAESLGHLDVGDSKPGRYLFTYKTTLPWLIINEYFDATQWGFNLRDPGPYHFQEAGAVCFRKLAENVRLPSPLPYLKSTPIKVR